MDGIILDIYVKGSVLIAIIDIILAFNSAKKNKTTGRYLAFAGIGAAVVDISYLISILNDSYFCMSVMSSIYFASIDIMLVCLLIFTVYYTKRRFTKAGKIALRVAQIYMLFEVVVFTINPFREIAVSYVWRDTLISKYSYQMYPLYWLHLFYTYFLVIVVVALLIHKMCTIPKEYRSQYLYVIIGILAIVSVNGIFLFWPGVSVYNLLDYSICGYSLTLFLLYWSCFNYSTHGMLNRLKTSIFESIDQGIVLFDYDDNLILHNERAEHLLGGTNLDEYTILEKFTEKYRLPLSSETEKDSFSLQCYVEGSEGIRPLRCDVRPLRNEKKQLLGQLFVFSDAELETDLLTGFQNWKSFQRFAKEEGEYFPRSTAVAICDINSLSVINSTMGASEGDQKIKELADCMRRCFPERTYYVRGNEANLIALCNHSKEKEMLEYLNQVKNSYNEKIQYAVSVYSEKNHDILEVIHEAENAMRAKKLLDQESIHSGMFTSLIRALQECDSDTESHVRRTQIMGAELGRRISLTDIQQSNLSLLCLLHDIGKIGIPLEILNKPGKLTEEEWKILQSHTEKGYEIANSNKELSAIAEEIRHHHERWDGKGYPDGLSRESIPLLSRVIAVVDAYDAMTNDRSYRAAMSPARAREELKRCAGTQFDPFIVSEFLQLLEENKEELIDNSPTLVTYKEDKPSRYSDRSIPEPEKKYSTHPVSYSRYLLNESMHIISVDENFEKITGYTLEDIQKNDMVQSDLIPEEERMEYLCQINALLAKSPMAFLEHKIRRKDGSDIYVFCYGKVYYDSAARAERSEVIISDIADTYSMRMIAYAEQNRAQQRLRYWEHTYRKDSLTGLLNHAAFRSDAELKLLEGKSKVMMLMMDVDKFKEYNDTYGHHHGDEFLILVAQTLLAALRREDRACRMGGDEFAAMLFFDLDTEETRMQERARQIFDKMNMTVQTVGNGTGISMGAVIASPENNSFKKLYELSDKALYEAKGNGRGRLVIHS